ncbi:anion permease, partial [bacterium]|nr:anion permease [bacterium]
MSQKHKTALFFAIVAVSAVTMFLPVPGLSPAGRRTLGVFVFAALCWITEVIPIAATGGIAVG